MSVVNRLFKIGQAEANAMVNRLENPVTLTEQGIRDMKRDLDRTFQALAEVKAMAVRARRDIEKHKGLAIDYEEKAIKLLKLVSKGGLDENEADRLAAQALVKKDEQLNMASRAMGELLQFEQSLEQLESNVSRLKDTIGRWENELQVLKARSIVSGDEDSTDYDAQIDSSSAIALLERMKDKVVKDEVLAQAYRDVIEGNDMIDYEIDQALKKTPIESKAKELAELKAKMDVK